MSAHIELGKEGESLAVDHLKQNGYTVLATNWKYNQREIDIIAEVGVFLVIVEVKTRSSNYLVEPYVAVNKQKQRDLIIAANAYVEQHEVDLDIRFDIISIVVSGDRHRIEHIEDAFYPLV